MAIDASSNQQLVKQGDVFIITLLFSVRTIHRNKRVENLMFQNNINSNIVPLEIKLKWAESSQTREIDILDGFHPLSTVRPR